MSNVYAFSVDYAVKYGLRESIMITAYMFWDNKKKEMFFNIPDPFQIEDKFPFWSIEESNEVLTSLFTQNFFEKEGCHENPRT